MRCVFWLTLLILLPIGATAQSVELGDLLKSNSHPITVSDGRLSGAGADFLMSATADARFVLVGEPHNVKQVPEITAMLFEDLHERHGFNHLAIEAGNNISRMLSAKAAGGKRDASIALARRYPNALQFVTDQELEMLVRVGGISTGKGDRIWGLDQAFGALDTLERLIKLAPNKQARDRTRELIETAREYEGERFAKNTGYLSRAARSDDFLRLAELYRPRRNSEAKLLLDQLLLSSRIYSNHYAAEAG